MVTMVSYLGKRTHKTLHKARTDETMVSVHMDDSGHSVMVIS
jgi:hypothetical protein